MPPRGYHPMRRIAARPLPEKPMDMESSLELLNRVKAGDDEALERLLARYVVPLRRWARGRLPVWARDMSDTQDLVQDAILKTLRHLHTFEPAGPGALHGYLRQAVMNRIRDELRRADRHPVPGEIDDDMEGDMTSPLDAAIGAEAMARYRAGLAQLSDDNRELVIAKVECDFSYQEIAAIFNKPSAAAAGMAVRRALLKLAEAMKPPDLPAVTR
jgi:RNA polymerase sigma-70 factor (ECF subfamily)